MNYIKKEDNNQIKNGGNDNFLKIPSNLERFINTETTTQYDNSGKQIYCFYGEITLSDKDLICNCCGVTKMQEVPFQDENHLITKALKTYTDDLLAKAILLIRK